MVEHFKRDNDSCTNYSLGKLFFRKFKTPLCFDNDPHRFGYFSDFDESCFYIVFYNSMYCIGKNKTGLIFLKESGWEKI